jgi:sugar transferase (PEP-CTERM/EpsH1 system associated)
MRILFVTSRFPFPPDKGDKIRAYHPIKLLSQHHEIDLLSFLDEPSTSEYKLWMKKFCKETTLIELRKFRMNLLLGAGLFSRYPSQVFCYRSNLMKAEIRRHLAQKRYDLVHLVCGRLAEYGKELHTVPTVIDWIDSLSLSTERKYRLEKNSLKRLGYHYEWKKMMKYEISTIRDFEACLMTSSVDKEYLKSDSIFVVPNGVDTGAFKPILSKKDVDIVFTGNMNYYPNVESCVFFCRDVLPLILKDRPKTTFCMVGKDPAKDIRRLHDGKNVIVTGYVDSIADWINKSRLFVAPMVAGAGIQNKILEAMACKVPVVSTELGNEGIGAEKDAEIVVADDPKLLADKILHMLRNTDKREKIAENAFELVRNRFSWEAVAAKIEQVYTLALNKRHVYDQS